MNLFETYSNEIKTIVKKNRNFFNLNNKNFINNIIVENPPEKFDYDLSSNAPMIIGKITHTNPRMVADKLKNLLNKEIKDFSKIDVAGPGFLNFKISKQTWHRIIEKILKSNRKYGSNKISRKYNVEFVSANPTGPMHVGHCRGAVFGDVLSNLLIFNGGKVTKEFYVNDYGNQIYNFVKSVYLRMREIKYKETFPLDKNLYPGSYIIDIANKILQKSKKINL